MFLANSVNCRSEPARDSGGSADDNSECTTTIASRLAPTGDHRLSGYSRCICPNNASLSCHS
ncbi:hypothetical protein DKY63_24030 [Pseudomonas putida]|uniref:Uncharacterized protein n=1 Tax=Pseudomonas putida TaxID=303 RepID=A0A2Z4RNZ0_PSEPU|nr:hypothetical protein DKY63_24030 [Pseudomonas putida]